MRFWIDLKYALRVLLQKPSFALMATFIMAIGLGLCVFNYSFIYGTSLKDLPYENGDRMRSMMLRAPMNFSPFDTDLYNEVIENQTSFSYIGVFDDKSVNVSGNKNAVLYDAAQVQPGFFEFTSTSPVMGRVFNEGDMVEGAKPVVVIGQKVWKNYLGGDPNVIGSEIRLDGVDTEVIGVMPEGYKFPVRQELWTPLKRDISIRSLQERIGVMGMLKPGVTDEMAVKELTTIYRRMLTENPERNDEGTPFINTFPEFSMLGIEGIFVAMTVATLLVLILAAVNVANLLYSRANERAKETAIRVALGAPSGRLVLQMIMESLIICTVGGVLAILLAQIGLDISFAYLSSAFVGEPPYFWDLTIDTHIVLVAIGLVITTAVVTGVFPALKIIRGDFNQVLRDGTRGAQSRQSGRVNKILVIVEVAVSCALLTASIMVALGNEEARRQDYGIEPKGLFTARVGLPEAKYPTDPEQTLFFEQLIDELNTRPGVEFAVGVNPLPGQGAMYRDIETEGFEKTQDNRYPQAHSAEVMPGALETLGVTLLKGRHFERSDDFNSEPVALVTNSFIEDVFPGEENVIGKRVRYVPGPDDANGHKWLTIVGVVEHVIQGQPYMPSRERSSIFTPMAQNQWREMSVVMKGDGDPMDMKPHLSAALAKLDKDVPMYREMTYQDSLDSNVAGMRYLSNVFSLFAIAALVLAATGIYGVIANSVSLRIHELGIRRALGASDEGVIYMLMKQGWVQLAIGFVIGLPLAFLMGRSMLTLMGAGGAFIYSMYVVVPLIIAAVVMFATYVPAKRAVSTEPSTALRYE